MGVLHFVFLALVEAALYQSYIGHFPKKSSEEKIDYDYLSSGVYDEKKRVENLMADGIQEGQNLTVLDLTKSYGHYNVVNDLTFAMGPSECLGILGGYNSGKTVLCKMLAGEVIPTCGNAFTRECNLINSLQKVVYLGYQNSSNFFNACNIFYKIGIFIYLKSI